MQRQFWKIGTLLFISLFLFTGCSSGTTDTGASARTENASASIDSGFDRDVINIAINRDITSLDGSGGGFTSTTASQHIFDGLCRLNTDMEPEPALATEWEMIDDLTWEFKLREGITFHDGSEFDANDVAFSVWHYTEAIDYKYAAQWRQAWPLSCEIIDQYTVQIKTQAPQPAVPRLLSRLAMIPEDYAGMSMEDFYTAPIGTGAFQFESWDPGICLTLTANEGYWRVTPKVKTLNYYTVSDDNARMAGFRSGEYQVVYAIPYDQIESIKQMEGAKVLTESTIGYDAIQFNFRFRPGSPIADQRIREAMTYAIDHQGICDVIMCGYQQPAAGPAPLNVLGAYDGGGFPQRDLEKAKELMEEAGYNGEEIIFAFHSGEFTSDVEVSELVLSQLQEAGFNVTYTQVESGAWSDMKGTDSWDITNNSVPGSFSGEAQYYYNQMKNLTALDLPEFDAIMDAADHDTQQSEEERAEDISAAMKIMWEATPYVFGTVPTSSIGMVESLEDFEYLPINWLMLSEAGYAE